MRPLRLLWICGHRTHRYEEVNQLLRAGVEVVPIATFDAKFPNAIDPAEERDPWYPRWRSTCTVPDDVLTRIRGLNYLDHQHAIAEGDRRLINEWFDVILVASYTRLLVSLLHWFKGHVILRAFGGHPYAGNLKPWFYTGHRRLNALARNDRYHWCPILPYLSASIDPRLTRDEVVLPACVDATRLPARWQAEQSDAVACESISMIAKYRRREYDSFVDSFGSIPLRIFGHNDKAGDLATDDRIVGRLDDDPYYTGLARCRVMIYLGLETRIHLHYHPLEALMMDVPVLFFASGSLAHCARWEGMSEDELGPLGLCTSRAHALRRARELLGDVHAAADLSREQAALRRIFAPETVFPVYRTFIDHLTRKVNYHRIFPDNFNAPDGTRRRAVKRLLLRAYQSVSG